MRFICDVMLGRLVKYMRILGLDTIAATAITELNNYQSEDKLPYFFTKRRTQKIPYNNCIYVKSDHVLDQLREIKNVIKPYIDKGTVMGRCIGCNALLGDVKKDDIEGRVPEFIFHKYDIFRACPLCKKVYWEGSHTEHMNKWVKEMLEPTGETSGR